jgi:hypothetical protein
VERRCRRAAGIEFEVIAAFEEQPIGRPLDCTVNATFVARPYAETPSTWPTSMPAIRTGESARRLTLLLTTAYSV